MSNELLIITLNELCESEGITEQTLIEVVTHGIASPVKGSHADAADWAFDTNSAYWIKKALRLHHDLEIDLASAAIAIDLLKKIEALQQENRDLRRQLERFYLEESTEDPTP